MKSNLFQRNYLKVIYLLTGLTATIWFIIRVIPKPSRALYPCQKAAFPIATAFILWIIGSIGSIRIIRKSLHKISSNWLRGSILLLSGCFIFFLSAVIAPFISTYANSITQKEEIPILKSLEIATIDDFKSEVAIVKSEKAKASDITADDIQALVEDAIEMAGGLNDIVHNGNTVVLKPNLVIDYSYAGYQKLSPGANGIVTDYRVIQAVVNIVNDLNPDGKIYLVEGSAKGHTIDNMKTVGWDKITGLDGFIDIEESSGDWYEYSSNKLSAVNLPDNVALYPDNLKPNKTRTIYQNKIYHDADVLICLPVLKNHCYTGITGAVKCVGIGGTPGKIYGTGQSDPDPTQRYGIEHGKDYSDRINLHKWIHDFYACRPIDFVVMDGIQGSDKGPVASGYSRLAEAQRNMRLILAGRDAIAVDAIESLIMRHDPSKIAHLVYLHNDGYGCANPALINVLGEQVQDIRVDFKIFDSGQASKYAYASCRDYQVKYKAKQENTLFFSISDTTNLGRVEIWVDGQKYPHLIVGQFNKIALPLGGFSLTDTVVSFLFTDKYLYSAAKELSQNFTSVSTPKGNYFECSVFPNPAGNYITIKYPGLLHGTFEIAIISLDGKMVYSKNFSDNSIVRFDIENLQAGQYLIRLKQDDLIATSRFIKTK